MKLVFRWNGLKISFLVAGTVANPVPAFTITDTKHFVPVVTLKPGKQLESGFKKTVNWNKYQSNFFTINGKRGHSIS